MLKPRCFAVLLIAFMVSLECLVYAADSVDFDIPPQSLSSALLDFSYQSKVQLIMPGRIAEGYFTAGLSGKYDIENALGLLIENTNLEYEFVSSLTVTIRAVASKQVSNSRKQKKIKKQYYYGLEQMLVTTEGREDEAQNLSVSILAINGEDLEKRGVTNADELQVFVPGLTIDSAQAGSTDFTIRGVGASNDDLTTDPGVVVYIDDIYIPRQGPANLAVYDLERVEVLRGPQGTLSGRNTPGGAIKYITRKPTPDFEARYLVDIGNLGRLNNTLTVNGELTERVYGQFAFAAFQRDGIMENRAVGQEDGNDIDNISARFSLRAVPNDDVELLITADTQNVDQANTLYSLGPNDGFRLDDSTPALERSTPERSSITSFSGGEYIDISGFMARANVLTDAFKVSYIFGYRQHNMDNHYDLDQQAQDLIREGLIERSQMKTGEVKIVSDRGGPMSLGGQLDWSIGLFYLREIGRAEKSFRTDGLGFGYNMWRQSIENVSAAIYGQATYSLTRQLRVTAGMRYSSDAKNFNLNASTNFPDPANPLLVESFQFQDKKRWSKGSPHFALSYHASENTLFYGSFSRGYKPGGFEGTPISFDEAIEGQFNREKSHNYEVGIKSKLFNNRVKFNLMGFVIDYDNFQVSGFERLGNPIILNAEKVDIRGVELEMEARPTINLHIGLGVSFLDSEFKKFTVMNEGIAEDKSGNPIPDSPGSTVNLSGIYTFKETRRGVISLRGDVIYSDQAKDEHLNISWPSYKVFNLWFDFVPHGGRWELGLWVRNLTNEIYYRGSLPGITAAISANARKLEPPKQYGTSFKFFW